MKNRITVDCLDRIKECMNDPVKEEFVRQKTSPDIDTIRSLFPPPTGNPAFDPALIENNIKQVETLVKIDTGHPFLDLSVKTGLAFIDATFRGDHPKYGVEEYGEDCHDGFPPTIIAAVDALSCWGLNTRAVQLFRHWIVNFVKDDGTIRYRGTSIAELGQILNTAALLDGRIGPDGWWKDSYPGLDRIAEWLLRQRRQAEGNGGLLFGVPEDDEKDKKGRYFHNNAWAVKGLRRWAHLCDRQGVSGTTPLATVRSVSSALAADTLKAIKLAWPKDLSDWWLPPRVEPFERPQSLTGTRDASYTNYRYWPELLASGLLPADMANRIVNARLSAGGQFCGMTRFEGHLDDWPLADHLFGLWALKRKDDFLLSLFGHISYHQAEGHLTAYEQVSFPPGRKMAAYCLPCQLVAARTAYLLQ